MVLLIRSIHVFSQTIMVCQFLDHFVVATVFMSSYVDLLKRFQGVHGSPRRLLLLPILLLCVTGLRVLCVRYHLCCESKRYPSLPISKFQPLLSNSLKLPSLIRCSAPKLPRLRAVPRRRRSATRFAGFNGGPHKFGVNPLASISTSTSSGPGLASCAGTPAE
jgi:hypothetical protein